MGVYVHLEYESVHEDGLGLVVFEVVETHRQESEQLQRGRKKRRRRRKMGYREIKEGNWVNTRRAGVWVGGWVGVCV